VDGAITQGDEIHGLISAGNQESRSQASIYVQPPRGATDDSGQRPVAERFASEGSSRRFTVEPYTADEKVSAPITSYFVTDTPQDSDQPNLTPQNHGLLTDSLAIDLASLRSEVQRFFAQIDSLGARGAERKIGMALCSGALVAAAAMACELARRQARRPVSGPVLKGNPQLGLGDEADDPASVELPNLAQFSAFS